MASQRKSLHLTCNPTSTNAKLEAKCPTACRSSDTGSWPIDNMLDPHPCRINTPSSTSRRSSETTSKQGTLVIEPCSPTVLHQTLLQNHHPGDEVELSRAQSINLSTCETTLFPCRAPSIAAYLLHYWRACSFLLFALFFIAAICYLFRGSSLLIQWFSVIYMAASLVILTTSFIVLAWQAGSLVQAILVVIQQAIKPELPNPVPLHPGAVFLQKCIAHYLQVHGVMERDLPPQIGFVSVFEADLPLWNSSTDGFVVIDESGLILWTNLALQNMCGYLPSELENTNIRILMPEPYKQSHDQYLYQYTLTGSSCVIGQERCVPIVNKIGIEYVVSLLVTECIQADSRYFIGRMRYLESNKLVTDIQSSLASGVIEVSAIPQLLQSSREPLLLVTPDGTILHITASAAATFEWSDDDLRGRNVRCLVPEHIASVYDNYLNAYKAHAMASLQESNAWPESVIMGTGRSFLAATKTGTPARVFVSIHVLHGSPKTSKEYLFLSKVTLLPSRFHNRTCFDDTSTGRQSLPMTPLSCRSARVTEAILRQCTIRRCNILMVQLRSIRTKDHQVECRTFLQCLARCSSFKGKVHSIVGDCAVLTFNSVAPSTSPHRSCAAQFLMRLLEDWGNGHLLAAAVAGDCTMSKWGHVDLILGEPVQLCQCLLRVARECQTSRPVIDKSLCDELHDSYDLRPINLVTIDPGEPFAKDTIVYELLGLKEVAEDEWMYALAADPLADPYRHWQQCWNHLSSPIPRNAPNLISAINCLVTHQMDFPADPVCHWLLEVLRRASDSSGIPQFIENSGHTRFLLHFALWNPWPNDDDAE